VLPANGHHLGNRHAIRPGHVVRVLYHYRLDFRGLGITDDLRCTHEKANIPMLV